MEILDQLRKRSRREWREMYKELSCNARIWIQEHGELALLLGVAAGVVVVVLFKMVLMVAVVLAVAAATIWVCAPEETKKVENDTVGKDGDSPAAH